MVSSYQDLLFTNVYYSMITHVFNDDLVPRALASHPKTITISQWKDYNAAAQFEFSGSKSTSTSISTSTTTTITVAKKVSGAAVKTTGAAGISGVAGSSTTATGAAVDSKNIKEKKSVEDVATMEFNLIDHVMKLDSAETHVFGRASSSSSSSSSKQQQQQQDKNEDKNSESNKGENTNENGNENNDQASESKDDYHLKLECYKLMEIFGRIIGIVVRSLIHVEIPFPPFFWHLIWNYDNDHKMKILTSFEWDKQFAQLIKHLRLWLIIEYNNNNNSNNNNYNNNQNGQNSKYPSLSLLTTEMVQEYVTHDLRLIIY